jgi:hypothetical protein
MGCNAQHHVQCGPSDTPTHGTSVAIERYSTLWTYLGLDTKMGAAQKVPQTSLFTIPHGKIYFFAPSLPSSQSSQSDTHNHTPTLYILRYTHHLRFKTIYSRNLKDNPSCARLLIPPDHVQVTVRHFHCGCPKVPAHSIQGVLCIEFRLRSWVHRSPGQGQSMQGWDLVISSG